MICRIIWYEVAYLNPHHSSRLNLKNWSHLSRQDGHYESCQMIPILKTTKTKCKTSGLHPNSTCFVIVIVLIKVEISAKWYCRII